MIINLENLVIILLGLKFRSKLIKALDELFCLLLKVYVI